MSQSTLQSQNGDVVLGPQAEVPRQNVRVSAHYRSRPGEADRVRARTRRAAPYRAGRRHASPPSSAARSSPSSSPPSSTSHQAQASSSHQAQALNGCLRDGPIFADMTPADQLDHLYAIHNAVMETFDRKRNRLLLLLPDEDTPPEFSLGPPGSSLNDPYNC